MAEMNVAVIGTTATIASTRSANTATIATAEMQQEKRFSESHSSTSDLQLSQMHSDRPLTQPEIELEDYGPIPIDYRENDMLGVGV